MKFRAFLLSFLILGLAPTSVLGESRLVDLKSLQQFKAAFNRDQGRTRIILLLSPT